MQGWLVVIDNAKQHTYHIIAGILFFLVFLLLLSIILLSSFPVISFSFTCNARLTGSYWQCKATYQSYHRWHPFLPCLPPPSPSLHQLHRLSWCWWALESNEKCIKHGTSCIRSNVAVAPNCYGITKHSRSSHGWAIKCLITCIHSCRSSSKMNRWRNFYHRSFSKKLVKDDLNRPLRCIVQIVNTALSKLTFIVYILNGWVKAAKLWCICFQDFTQIAVCVVVQVDLSKWKAVYIVGSLLFTGLWIANNGRQGKQITSKLENKDLTWKYNQLKLSFCSIELYLHAKFYCLLCSSHWDLLWNYRMTCAHTTTTICLWGSSHQGIIKSACVFWHHIKMHLLDSIALCLWSNDYPVGLPVPCHADLMAISVWSIQWICVCM